MIIPYCCGPKKPSHSRLDLRSCLHSCDSCYSWFKTVLISHSFSIAQQCPVPVYTVFTNEQLAQMVQRGVNSKAALREIEGVGEARIEKYADRILLVLSSLVQPQLSELFEEVRDDRFSFGRFSQFVVYDPELRVISAPSFRERIVHHAIMNVCEPHLDRWLISDSFACRKV